MKLAATFIVSIVIAVSGCTGAPPDAESLSKAVGDSDRKLVKTLLSQGANPNSTNSGNLTPLVIAAMNGDVDVMKLLVEAGADVNFSPDEVTPLCAAIGAGKSNAVAWLVNNGAKLETTTDKGVTPLMFALILDKPSAASFLIHRGANVNAQNSAGNSILIFAITAGHDEVARKLIEKDANVNAQTKGNRTTALMMASHRDMRDVATLLLAKGAQTDLIDAFGKSALDYAKSEEMKDILTRSPQNSVK